MSARPALIVGVGLSSRATAAEVRELVERLLARHGTTLADVTAIATRSTLARDARLDLGPAVIGHQDAALVAASPPCDRFVGIPARVAETAALLSASGYGAPRLLGSTVRSRHATASIAVVLTEGAQLGDGGLAS